MSTYRVTIKYWDRHYGDGHVQFKRSFEARTSKKADQEAIDILETALRSHPNPQGRVAQAWAERSDQYGPRTLRAYDGASGKWVRVDPMRPAEARRPHIREHHVADFNTVDDLVEHAAHELGATHILYVDDEIHIYFPRQDGLYEKAEVWQKGGYWHAQGPGKRTVVRKLPVGAKPIRREHEREEGPHSWKPGMMRAARRDGPKQATKPGKYGTLKLWLITYTDADNPAFGEDSYRTWAYDKEDVWLTFTDRVGAEGESWEIVKIEPVIDSGPQRLSREMRASGRSTVDAVKAMRVYLGSVDFASLSAQQRLYNRAMKAVESLARARDMDPEAVWRQVEVQARREGIIRPTPGQHF